MVDEKQYKNTKKIFCFVQTFGKHCCRYVSETNFCIIRRVLFTKCWSVILFSVSVFCFFYLRLKKKMLCFRFPDRLVKICADCNFFSAQKKKKKVGDRPCSTIPVFIKSQNHFVTRICPRRFSDIFGL